MTSVKSWAIDRARVCSVGLCVDVMNASATRVKNHTPRYDHFISDSQYVRSMAKSQLISFGAKELLNNDVVKLFHAIAQVKSVHQDFGGAVKVEDHPTYKDDVASAATIFDMAKKNA